MKSFRGKSFDANRLALTCNPLCQRLQCQGFNGDGRSDRASLQRDTRHFTTRHFVTRYATFWADRL